MAKFGKNDLHMIRVYNYDTGEDKRLRQPQFIDYLKLLEERCGPNNTHVQIEKCAVICNGALNDWAYHAMVVIKLKSGIYVSFERLMHCALIQLSIDPVNLIHRYRGDIRRRNFSEPHLETPWAEGNSSLLNIFQIIFFKDYFGRCYNKYTNNCQQFAKLIYKHASVPGSKRYHMLRTRKCGKEELPPRPES